MLNTTKCFFSITYWPIYLCKSYGDHGREVLITSQQFLWLLDGVEVNGGGCG